MRALFDSVETREGFIDRFGSVTDSVRVALSADQVRALNTTPQILINAPGPNKFILIDTAIATLYYRDAVFTGANDVEIRATNGAGTILTEDGFSAAFLNGAANAIAVESGVAYWGEVIRSLDQPVVAVVPVANPGGALSTSILTIILNYKIMKTYNI